MKARLRENAGYAAEAVDRKKQGIICRVSDHYRMSAGLGGNTQIRFDVIAVDGEEINWIKNAFDYTGKAF